jgi:two-component system OmpR family sensor kinase
MSDDPSQARALSIRTRLTLAVGAVLLVTLVLSGVMLIRGTRATLVRQVDVQVIAFAQRAEGRERPGGQEPGTQEDDAGDILGRSTAYLEYSASGELLRADPSGFIDDPDPLPQLPTITSRRMDAIMGRIVSVSSTDGSLRYRVLVRRAEDGRIAATAAPLTRVDEAVSRMVRLLLIVGGIALIAASAACWWLIRRGLRPVDRMVDTAAAIAAGDRPTRPGAERDAPPDPARHRGASRERGTAAPLRRRCRPRAADAADLAARLRGALPSRRLAG